MKTMKFFTTLVLALVLCANANARVWRVNASPTAGADFSTVQAAIDTASAGDEIQIEGGSYPGFIVAKPLTILGTVFSRSAHEKVKTPAEVVYITGDVHIYPEASGSLISSVNFRNTSANLYVEASNTYITRCDIYRLYLSVHTAEADETIEDTYLNNVFVSSSYIAGCYHYVPNTNYALFVSNATFNNCIVEGLYLPDVSSKTNVPCSFTNCIVSGDSYNMYYAYNSNFTNCIFNYTNSSFSTSQSYVGFILSYTTNNNVLNCLFRVPAPTGSDLTDAHTGTNCIFDTESDVYDNVGYYTIGDDSPAKGAGIGGEDLGVYGGSSPFVPGGYRSGATITNVVMPTQVGNSATISIEAAVIE